MVAPLPGVKFGSQLPIRAPVNEMAADGNDHQLKRIVLPSGKTIEVVSERERSRS